MKTIRHIRPLLILAAAVLTALAAFCYCAAQSARWEARATLAVRAEDALPALPGLLTSEVFAGAGAVSAHHIPGTCLLEIACRASDPDAATAGLDASIARIPTLLDYLDSEGAPGDILKTALSMEKSPISTPKVCLFSGISGEILAFLLLYPPQKQTEPLELSRVLRRFFRLGRRFWPLILTVCLLTTGGSCLRLARSTPVWESTALVSLGEYDPAATAKLSDTVLGLMESSLCDDRVSAVPLGKSNLFQFSARGESPEEAHALLESAIRTWPGLAAYALEPLPMTVRETPTLPEHPVNSASPLRALLQGLAAGIFLWAVPAALWAMAEERRSCAKC